MKIKFIDILMMASALLGFVAVLQIDLPVFNEYTLTFPFPYFSSLWITMYLAAGSVILAEAVLRKSWNFLLFLPIIAGTLVFSTLFGTMIFSLFITLFGLIILNTRIRYLRS